MKRLLAMLMAFALIITVTACSDDEGSSAPVSTPTPAAQTQAAASTPQPTQKQVENNENEDDEDDEDAGYDEDVEAYVNSMGELISMLNELMEVFGDLLANAESIETDDELVEWCQSFITLKETVGNSADELAVITQDVPEEYQESHVKITIALAAVYDAMTGFENSVDATLNGDEDAYWEGIGEFIGNLAAADELWSEAVEVVEY